MNQGPTALHWQKGCHTNCFVIAGRLRVAGGGVGLGGGGGGGGCVSLTFRELSKIISWKYTIPEITFFVRTSSWTFVSVPKALATYTKIQLEILLRCTISAIHKFRGNTLESPWNVSETTPRHLAMLPASTRQTELQFVHFSCDMITPSSGIWLTTWVQTNIKVNLHIHNTPQTWH